MPEPTVCPCDTGKPYESCCGRFHGGRPAPTAVALMRSRYSAFLLGLDDYLLATWHPDTRPPVIEIDPLTTWTGLTVESVSDGNAWDNEGIVQFTASYLMGDHGGALRERSHFVVVDGRWVYVDGVT